jgi:hypothetical protein
MVENQSAGAPSFRVLCGGWAAAPEWQETASGLAPKGAPSSFAWAGKSTVNAGTTEHAKSRGGNKRSSCGTGLKNMGNW